MPDEKSPFLKYLREDRLPTIFCPGCGIGTIINSFLKGVNEAELDFDNLALVSGIGCSSRIPGYIQSDSLHTTHGRAISFATGLKVSNSDLDVVVFTGDGDAASIGGNHLIHAARRNINLTVICINNNIYGMTGGQISPTSPKGSFGSTAPYGTTDNPFNLAELVATAGASYSARWTTLKIHHVVRSIKDALKNPGFSFVEVISQCPTYFGRKNKLRSPVDMISYMKNNTVFKAQVPSLSRKELEGKIIVGEFANTKKPEFVENIKELSKSKSDSEPIQNSAYLEEF
ncbi:MAG: 2-oxoacid:ferredoxin oxidoreductase subunit beta [Methanobacteriaceae archaeon]|jgi:2-oxoglutarate ferredoxin oxidoreductase subunit beta|nr:2-oxoacid:ferredoxin oxidoreductase subunit beta [Methanobacteriaceae archaeon]